MSERFFAVRLQSLLLTTYKYIIDQSLFPRCIGVSSFPKEVVQKCVSVICIFKTIGMFFCHRTACHTTNWSRSLSFRGCLLVVIVSELVLHCLLASVWVSVCDCWYFFACVIDRIVQGGAAYTSKPIGRRVVVVVVFLVVLSAV